MLPQNEVCVIDNGKSYLFNKSGVCIKEDAGLLPKYTTGMVELPIISVLSSNRIVEIAIFNNNGVEMRRFSTSLDPAICALTLQKIGGFVRILRRDGKCEDTSFNQLILVYKVGTDLMSIINNLNVQEVYG